MKLLEVKNLSIAFGGLLAVNELSLNIGEHEIVGLIGPNGSGKTTAINGISGFLTPQKGQVMLAGKDVIGMKPYKIAAVGISRTFQLTNLLTKVTVLDNVMAGLHLNIGVNVWDALMHAQGGTKEKRAREKAFEILEFTGLFHERHKICESVSNYSRKCLGLAMALAVKPRITLIDEVVSGLSASETEGVMDLINRIRESGVSILLVEHNMRVIMGLCDRIVVLSFGTKIAEGTPAEISANQEVQEAYLGGCYNA